MSAILTHISGFVQFTILISNMKKILLSNKQNTSFFPQEMSFSQNLDLLCLLEVFCAWNHYILHDLQFLYFLNGYFFVVDIYWWYDIILLRFGSAH